MPAKKRPAKKRAVRKTTKRPVRKSSKTVHKKRKNTNKPTTAFAIAVLVINVIVPGLGSLVAGKTKAGVWQLILLFVGTILSIVLIGIPIVIAAWIWGIVTGARLIQEAE